MPTRPCSRRASVVLFLLGTTSIGCGEEDVYRPARCSDFAGSAELPDIPVAYTTEHLDIHVADDRILCAGTALEYERHYQYVGRELGVPLPRRVKVFIMRTFGDHCPPYSRGCFEADGTIFSKAGATHHELAHAAACEARSYSAPALAEGLAKSFEVTKLTAKVNPFEFIELPTASALSYDQAGHFVRWLLETYGSDLFLEAFEVAPRGGGEGVLEVLEDVYGQPVEELFSEYEASAPYMWAPHRQCADLEVIEPEGGVWEFNAIFDCDDPSTLGPYERWGDDTNIDVLAPTTMYQSFLIEIDTPGTYRFERELHETNVEIERCVEQQSSSEAEAEQLWHRQGLFPTLQGTTDVELRAGTYRVDVRRQYAEPHPVWVRIAPVPG